MLNLEMILTMKLKFIFMDKINHNKNVIEVCKNSIDYIKLRQEYLLRDNLLREYKAISEEFKEWLKKGYQKENIIYLIDFLK
tara:strand:- start:361 stop:606 length:246 start_codon:yes stop_codon:yes gene_type:complete